MATALVAIGEYQFDPDSGEVRRLGASTETVRLQPQPARLLALLAEKNGELLTRDEIRAALWPDVQVDFDRSLNFCVHQLRGALRDSGSSSAYIETLPRRGYRLTQPVRQADPVPAQASFLAPESRWWSLRRVQVAAALILLAGAAGVRYMVAGRESPRLAIMAFQPPDGAKVVGQPWQIAEILLLELGSLGPEILRVIGPATTAPYSSRTEIRQLVADVELDYLVNGHFIEPAVDSETWTLLVELIRVSDGAHVWVESYSDCTDPPAIARQILPVVRSRLGLASAKVIVPGN